MNIQIRNPTSQRLQRLLKLEGKDLTSSATIGLRKSRRSWSQPSQEEDQALDCTAPRWPVLVDTCQAASPSLLLSLLCFLGLF